MRTGEAIAGGAGVIHRVFPPIGARHASSTLLHMVEEPLSRIDAAWLRMDEPTNPMVVSTLLTFDEPMHRARFLGIVKERVLGHARFRQRVVESRLPFAAPRWVEDRRFRVEEHVVVEHLPAPGDEATMQRIVGKLIAEPLPRDRPLWRAHVLEGAARGGAVLFRLHHCVGDGVALVRMLLTMVDEGAGIGSVDVGFTPAAPARWMDRGREAVRRVSSFFRMLTLPNDPRTSLRGRLGTHKGVAWSAPIPLEDVRRAAHRRGAKVNDLLVSAIVGGIGTHLRAHDDLPKKWRDPRALVPVYVRGADVTGNHFGLVFLALPVGIDDADRRLAVVKARMDEIKSSPDPVVALDVLALLGMAPLAIERFGIELFTSKASVMITDVPGPPMRIHLAGATVRSMVLWAPVGGRLGVSIGLLSYAGEVRIGVSVDLRRVADPYALLARFEHELAALGVLTTDDRAPLRAMHVVPH